MRLIPWKSRNIDNGAPAFYVVVFMWILHALAWAAADTSFDALIGDLIHEKRGTVYGVYTGLELLGAMSGPLVGSLAWTMSPETPFHLSALLLSSCIPIFSIFIVLAKQKNRLQINLRALFILGYRRHEKGNWRVFGFRNPK